MNLSTFGKRAGWLAFAFPLVVYTLTLCPTVYWDDAGELITAAYTLGIPHPPGHPLYALIGKLFTLIPAGSVAWRVNFMSAFFGAVSCLLVYMIIGERLEESSWKPAAALGGAFFFAFSPTVWDQATVAENSTLHCFFMMLLTLLAFRMASGGIVWKSEARSLCLFSFLYGLSLTNHVAGVFFFPAFAYLFIATHGKRFFMPRSLLKMLFWFVVGLLVYAYLPIRSLADPPLDWGNPENLTNFLWVVTARQFSPNLLSELNVFAIAANLSLRAQDLLHQFTVVGCALGVVGAWTLIRGERRVIIFSLLVIMVLFYIGLNTAFISAYFIPAMALMAIWIGVGLQQSIGWIIRLSGRIRARSVAIVVSPTLCVALASSFVLPLTINCRDMDRSDDLYALRYGEEILDRLPEDSAFFTVDVYALFILWYLINCENRRSDLMIIEPTWLTSSNALSSQVIEQYPDLVLPSPDTVANYSLGVEDPETRQYMVVKAIMDENYKRRPVYWGVIQRDLPFSRNLVPLGIVSRYSPEPVVLDDEMLARNREFWNSELEFLMRNPAMKRDKVAQEIYPVELNNLGLMFEGLGRDDLSRWAIELALRFNPDFPISRYNLGRLEARAGRHDEAARQYRLAVQGNPCMATAYYGLGNAYRNLGRFDDAFLAYRRATRLYPAYYEAMTALGQLYLLARQNGDAAEKFEEALEVEPDYVFALRGLASVYIQTGRLDEAKAVLDRSLELDPDSAAGLFALAKYYARVGSRESALSALRRSVEVGGNAMLEQALADDDLKKVSEALSESEVPR